MDLIITIPNIEQHGEQRVLSILSDVAAESDYDIANDRVSSAQRTLYSYGGTVEVLYWFEQ
jgi:hypothetical protein